jgi:hypothetical protein
VFGETWEVGDIAGKPRLCSRCAMLDAGSRLRIEEALNLKRPCEIKGKLGVEAACREQPDFWLLLKLGVDWSCEMTLMERRYAARDWLLFLQTSRASPSRVQSTFMSCFQRVLGESILSSPCQSSSLI